MHVCMVCVKPTQHKTNFEHLETWKFMNRKLLLLILRRQKKAVVLNISFHHIIFDFKSRSDVSWVIKSNKILIEMNYKHIARFDMIFIYSKDHQNGIRCQLLYCVVHLFTINSPNRAMPKA